MRFGDSFFPIWYVLWFVNDFLLLIFILFQITGEKQKTGRGSIHPHFGDRLSSVEHRTAYH